MFVCYLRLALVEGVTKHLPQTWGEIPLRDTHYSLKDGVHKNKNKIIKRTYQHCLCTPYFPLLF